MSDTLGHGQGKQQCPIIIKTFTNNVESFEISSVEYPCDESDRVRVNVRMIIWANHADYFFYDWVYDWLLERSTHLGVIRLNLKFKENMQKGLFRYKVYRLVYLLWLDLYLGQLWTCWLEVADQKRPSVQQVHHWKPDLCWSWNWCSSQCLWEKQWSPDCWTIPCQTHKITISFFSPQFD